LAAGELSSGKFLRQIVPYGIAATANTYGIEGFHLKDVLGTVAVAVAGCVSSEPHFVGIETRGDLTRGMTVIDTRATPAGPPNARVATGVAVAEVRTYIEQTLKRRSAHCGRRRSRSGRSSRSERGPT